MAVTSFIPEIWSARLLHALDNAHVAANLVNRDYEGEISKAGDTVHINSIGAITVSSYTANTDINAPETLATTDQTLLIDQSKYFNFQIDDVDKAQAAGDLMDQAMSRAAYALNNVSDAFLLQTIATGAGTTIGTQSAPIALTAANVYSEIVAMRTALDTGNASLESRAIIVPPAVYALLLQDERFVKSSQPTADNVLLHGNVGEVAGFKVYESNNVYLPTTGVYQIAALTPEACTYAEQIVSTEAYRMEKRFADAVKGLHVYGAKVVLPAAAVSMFCSC